MLRIDNVRLPSRSEYSTVLIDGGKIVDVSPVAGKNAHAVTDGEVIDGCGGLILPGFVDVHSHSDRRYWEPDLGAAKRAQGVAHEIVGNCGMGPAPTGDSAGAWRPYVRGTGIGPVDVEWEFRDVREYVLGLHGNNAGYAPGIDTLLPYGAVRAAAAGFERELSAGQRDAVRQTIANGLEAGAVGVSLGLVYPPNDAASFDELTYCLAPLRDGGVLTVHIRSQANGWIEAIDEVLAIARHLGIRLNISHLCVGGSPNQWKAEWVISRLLHERQQGLDVWFDQHPYTAGSTSITQLVPSWAIRSHAESVQMDLTLDELRQYLSKPSRYPGWENYVDLIGADNILIASARNMDHVVGHTLGNYCEQTGTDSAEGIARIVEQTGGEAAIVLLNLYSETVIDKIARLHFGTISTDGLHVENPHPRLFGTYPYAFDRFVRRGVLTEEEFTRKAASLPLQIFGLSGCRAIEAGEPANIVIIDPETFAHSANYLDPEQPVTGLTCSIYDGQIMETTGEKTG